MSVACLWHVCGMSVAYGMPVPSGMPVANGLPMPHGILWPKDDLQLPLYLDDSCRFINIYHQCYHIYANCSIL